jgi:hypothetical protein
VSNNDLADILPMLLEQHEAKKDIVRRLRADLKAAETELARDEKRLNSFADAVHRAAEVDAPCKGHKYRAEPSGRGVGFDEVCARCGFIRNPRPMY